MDCKLIALQSYLLNHFNKSFYRKRIMLHGNTEMFFHFFSYVTAFQQIILLRNLSGVSEELFSISGYDNSFIRPDKEIKSQFLFQLLYRA